MLLLLSLACGPKGILTVDDSGKADDSAAQQDDSDVTESVPGVDDSEEEIDPNHAADFLFAGDFIPEFNIVLSNSAVRSLTNDPYTWVQGTIVYDGTEYGPVGVRVKGENSYLPITQKASLKIKMNMVDDTLRFYGLKELTFNNMSGDYSMMHERVSYRFFREAGMPASRVNHAHLSLNGEEYGLFSMIETVDDEFLEYRFEQPEGSMWEFHDVDFYDQYIDSFSFEEGVDDRTVLQGLADVMELSSEEAVPAADPYLDYDQFLNFWAAQIIIGQFDSYPYGNPGDDCHIYADPARDGRLIFFPHGMDETFYYPDQGVLTVNGVIARKCLRVDSCQASLIAKIWAMQTAAEQQGLLAYHDQIQAQIAPYVASDPNRPYDAATVAAYQSYMRSFIADRVEHLEPQIGSRP